MLETYYFLSQGLEPRNHARLHPVILREEMSTTERPPQGTPPDRRSSSWNPGRASQGRRGNKRRVVQGSGFARFLMRPVGKILLGIVLLAVITGGGAFIYYYNKYARVIDDRLKGGAYTATSRIYAAPESVDVGDTSAPDVIATDLRRAGFTASAAKMPSATTRSSLIRSISFRAIESLLPRGKRDRDLLAQQN